MLPIIHPEMTLAPLYQSYLAALQQADFKGDIKLDYATRLTVATDNSIYQVIPEAVLFPRSTNDISIALTLSQEQDFRSITFSPRGGGTGTNGQSLSAGIVIDCSRYLRSILETNLEQGWVRVQPGVILDQLNQHLRPMGVHFAPEISPSNRATIGGMVNTDACGNGSKIIGRTSDHIIDLECVLPNGNIITTQTPPHDLDEALTHLLKPHQSEIKKVFFDAPRTLGGYNLAKTWQEKLHLHYLLCGSEGTLGIISECKLKLTPLPAFKKLVVIQYHHFKDALNPIEITPDIQPLVIETLDEKLISLARTDAIYHKTKNAIGDAKSINLVEFISHDKSILENQIQLLSDNIKQHKHIAGYYIAGTLDEIKQIWELRKKAVGLISKKTDGTRRPIPFIEDTAVPPEKLADYIQEFTTLLDSHQLIYGMYGHVDAGCVHVRPALDLTRSHDEKLLRTLSNQVVTLVKKYNGVMWGEHGKGFRSEYGSDFFGDTLYGILRKIKSLFDPHNQLNPGKIATPFSSKSTLVKLDESLRGHEDKQISTELQNQFSSAMTCNGNGACFNFATNDVMCPSYKVTQDRRHSPKGRAVLIREWIKQLSLNKENIRPQIIAKTTANRQTQQADFSHEVFQALDGCLSCKACTNQCPLSVNIPDLKSNFLNTYHQRYRRPLKDYVIANTEFIARIQAIFPRFSNWITSKGITKSIIKTLFKLTDLPEINSAPFTHNRFNIKTIKELNKTQLSHSLILLQDAFTSFYEQPVLRACYEFFTLIGYTVHIVPFFENGKPLHVKGFTRQFNRLASKNIHYLRKLSQLNIPMIGIDPSMTLALRDEYQQCAGNEKLDYIVHLPQEFIALNLHRIPNLNLNKIYYLLSHCTEKTALPESETQWKAIFNAFGLTLTPLAAGCCGMAGAYGHEIQHQQRSQALFDLDWKTHLTAHTADYVLATGYSCRSQTSRFGHARTQHPLELLTTLIKENHHELPKFI